jgi:hypothetical protein
MGTRYREGVTRSPESAADRLDSWLPSATMRVQRAVAQLGSAPALGAGGRRFKSGQPDRPQVSPPAVTYGAARM